MVSPIPIARRWPAFFWRGADEFLCSHALEIIGAEFRSAVAALLSAGPGGRPVVAGQWSFAGEAALTDLFDRPSRPWRRTHLPLHALLGMLTRGALLFWRRSLCGFVLGHVYSFSIEER